MFIGQEAPLIVDQPMNKSWFQDAKDASKADAAWWTQEKDQEMGWAERLFKGHSVIRKETAALLI